MFVLILLCRPLTPGSLGYRGIRNANTPHLQHKLRLCLKTTERSPAMALSNQIVFFDTTLRDGEQSPGCTMHHNEKLRMAHQLAALGVDIIEAGFAIASQGDFNSVNAIAKEVSSSEHAPRIASLARCKREDIEAAARAVEPARKNRIHT